MRILPAGLGVKNKPGFMELPGNFQVDRTKIGTWCRRNAPRVQLWNRDGGHCTRRYTSGRSRRGEKGGNCRDTHREGLHGRRGRIRRVAVLTCKVAILVSGTGTNMEALIDAMNDPDFGAEPVLVLANNPDAVALCTAHRKNVPTSVVDHRNYRHDRRSFDRK